MKFIQITYFLLFVFVYFLCGASCENKYSRSANAKEKDNINFRTLEKPFRMNKLNILWAKAQHVSLVSFLNNQLLPPVSPSLVRPDPVRISEMYLMG